MGRSAVSRKALAEATRSLAVLVGARLPLLEALETVSRQASNGRLKAALESVRGDVRRGVSVSAGLSRHPDLFDPLFVQLVRVGEMTGQLGSMLGRLATYLEKSAALRRNIRLAMVYPGVVLGVAVAAVVFLLRVIVPTFAEMYADFGAELPGPTRALLAVSDVLGGRVWVSAIVLAGVIVAGRWALQMPAGRPWREAAVLHLPLIGPLLRKSLSARFSRTLGTLLQGGVHLVDALDILARTAGHSQVESAVRAMEAHVAEGGRLAGPLRGRTVFPEFVVQMIALGEETAHLDGMLLHAAGHFEAEVDAGVEALTSVIEPVLIVVLGIVLGGILVAMYLPLFELSTVIR
jgi:type IV pilus assembly protein PilC